MRASMLLLAALLLAGCSTSREVGTLPLGVPPPADLLPREVPGYALGYESGAQAFEAAGAIDGHTRTFDGQANGTGASLTVSATRFATPEDAHAAFASVIERDPGGTTLALGDEAVAYERPPDQGSTRTLFARRASVLWYAQHAPYGPGGPGADMPAILAPYVALV